MANRKEYNDRWFVPLVNKPHTIPPTTYVVFELMNGDAKTTEFEDFDEALNYARSLRDNKKDIKLSSVQDGKIIEDFDLDEDY